MTKFVNLQNLDELGKNIESEDYLKNYLSKNSNFIVPVDYSTSSNFARYGLAELYYEDSIKRIYKNFPYDGSRSEIEEYFKNSTGLDNFIFENLYPRTNGYVQIGNNWGTQQFVLSGYGAPQSASYEYIQVKGGPNLGFDLSGDRYTPKISSYFENSNVYDPTKNRTSNLKFNTVGTFSGSNNGISVEFWLKKTSFNTSLTSKEVIFDLWNSVSSGSHDYGRLTIEMDLTGSNSAFRVTCMSGTSGISYQELGSGNIVNVSNVANGKWKHYCFTFHVNDDSDLETNLYVNGTHNDKKTVGSPISTVTGSMIANIGALRTSPSGNLGSSEGHGKLLSSSLDEFRFWKVKRSEEEILKFYNRNVGGGSNSDDHTTKLGIYYKFNEGITTTSSVDSTILDYSGRVSNGNFVGYSQSLNPRMTGSAIVESSASLSEFKDPILYSFHNDVRYLLDGMTQSGSVYDQESDSAIYYEFPDWITEEDYDLGGGELKKLCQILGSSLDNLNLKINFLSKFKHQNYYDPKKFKQLTFVKSLLENSDFVAPDLFSQSTIFEQFLNSNLSSSYELELEQIKNSIYQNIYNNLVHIYKMKGTEDSFRNLLRCVGIDDNIVNVSLYANNQTFELKDNFKNTSKFKKVVNFYDGDNFNATVYQLTQSGDSVNSKSFISSSGIPEYSDFTPFTVESQVIFPRKYPQDSKNYIHANFLTCSLFGFHNALGEDQSDLTWQLPETASLQVFCLKDEIENPNVRFFLTGTTVGNFPTLTSSYFPNVYSDEKWNFAISVRNSKYPYSNLVSGSSLSGESNYTLEFYGVSTVFDTISTFGQLKKEFLLTSSLTNEQGRQLLRSNKRVYCGAHRENFTGSTLQKSDVQISNVRSWINYLPTSSVLAHSKFYNNKSIEKLYQYAYLNNQNIPNVYVPNLKTLIFDWNFSLVSSSNDLGQFFVYDESSGSNSINNDYNWISNITKFQYPARGDFFNSEDTNVISKKWIDVASQTLPEVLNSSDMIEIKDENTEVYSKDSRPLKYSLIFEKSMYSKISEDMMSWFTTIGDFSNIIGLPVEKYRTKYKALEKLRKLYFQNVENEPDFEKFLQFYKWIDNNILKMLAKLAPESSNVSQNTWDVLESHMFERNKYEHKFPLLEYKTATSGSLKGVGFNSVDTKELLAPFPRLEESNGLWWDVKGGLDTTIWPDLNSTTKNNRKTLKNLKIQDFNRTLNLPVVLKIDNFSKLEKSKEFELNNLFPFGKTDSLFGYSNSYVISGSDIQKLRSKYNTDLKSEEVGISKKYKFAAKSFNSDYSGSLGLFQLVSSSVTSEISNVIGKNIKLAGLHVENRESLQGPFTRGWVGGWEFQHTPLNTGSDNSQTRPEKYKIYTTGSDVYVVSSDFNVPNYVPHQMWSRREYIKRPLNIQNIRTLTGSNKLGNFFKNYEVVNTCGRNVNNLYLRESQTLSASITGSTTVYGLYDFPIPRRDLTGSKSIIVNRFSSPGSPDVSAIGFLDLESAEFSPYNTLNYRNLSQRFFLDQLWSTASLQFGVLNSLNPASASYHRIPRNPNHRITLNGVNFQTSSKYDNLFVQHAIPRSDLNYSWVKYSAVSASNLEIGNIQSFPFGFMSKSLKDSTYGGIIYLSSSEFGSYEIEGFRYFGSNITNIDAISGHSLFPMDFVGLNTNIYEPISSSQSILGYDQLSVTNPAGSPEFHANYINTNVVLGGLGEELQINQPTPGLASLLNSLLLKRNGPYGFPSWKQIRMSEHPISRFNKFNNIIQISVNPTQESDFTPLKPYKNLTFIEPVVSDRFLHIENIFKFENRDLSIYHGYGNNLEHFSNFNLEQMLEFSDKKNVQYENIKNLYMSEEKLEDLEFVKLKYSENVFPRNKNVGLNRTRNRYHYAESGGYSENGYDRRSDQRRTFWPENIERSGITSSTPHKNSVEYYSGRSVFPLGNQLIWYSETEAITPNTQSYYIHRAKVNSGSFYGELSPVGSSSTIGVPYSDVNSQGMLGYGQSYISGNNSPIPQNFFNFPTASMQFVYLPYIGKFTEYSYPYDVPNLSGKRPWYNDYEEYSQDLKHIGKLYSTISEFRISDHIEHYVKNGNSQFSNKNDFLKLEGSYLSKSSNDFQSSYIDEFFEKHVNTDILKHYGDVLEDHKKINKKVTKITLECQGLKKLLPYNGFYPMTRTTQLGAIFSQSLAPYISGTFYAVQNSASLALQSLLQPFFAPGIVFNTIKSGIAVDWPVFTASLKNSDTQTQILFKNAKNGQLAPGQAIGDTIPYDNFSLFISASGCESSLVGEDDWREYLLTSSHNKQLGTGYSGKFHARIPFESLVDLNSNLLKNKNIYLNVVDKILQSSGSAGSRYPYFHWVGLKEPQFEMSMHNFLSEVPNFFLKNGQVTTFTSEPEKNFKVMEYGKTYYMDVVLRKTNDFHMIKSFFSGNTPSGSSSDLGAYDVQMTYDGRYFGPPSHAGPRASYQQGNVNDTRAIHYADPAYAPFTPPYFYGDARVRLSFAPQTTRKYSVDEILANCIASSSISAPTSMLDENVYFAQENSMRIDASVNLLGKVNSLKVADSTGFDQWAISTKFECPVLDFSGSNPSPDIEDLLVDGAGTPYQNAFLGKGIWSTYGKIPSGSTGIYLSVEESFPEDKNTLTITGSTRGSLIEICGFQQKNQRIGELRDSKKVFEAVVAIPFLERNEKFTTFVGGKNFIKIKPEIYSEQLKTPKNTSISNMIEKMKNYYFPPFMDFSNLKSDVEPFVVYIFEFSDILDKEDLSDVWQGLMPKISQKVSKENIQISHDSGIDEFFHGEDPPKDLRWMTFKVKRKANKNYYDLIPSTKESKKNSQDVEKSISDYNYNWPYDYFSLVEMAKMSVKYEIG